MADFDDDDECLHLRDKGRRNGNRQQRLLAPTALHFMIVIIAVAIAIIIVNVVVVPFNLLNLYFYREEGQGRG